MAGEAESDGWPLPRFHFVVQFDDGRSVAFEEVSGLETETSTIEYRHGNSQNFSLVKMPRLARVSNVTMKKGIFVNENRFWTWYNEIKMNTIQRRTVVIRLLDETGAPTMVWTLQNARPTKISGTDLRSEGDGVAVESIELAFESFTVAAT